MDELKGAILGADQWEMLEKEARRDHPEHEETDSGHCPICYEEGSE